MIVRIRILFLIIFFLPGSFNTLIAQDTGKRSNDTLETFFTDQHQKDGYEVNGRILNIPDDIAAKCHKKKIRVIGNPSYVKAVYDSNHIEDSTVLRQGRYEYVPVENDTGAIELERHFVSTGSNFSIISISTWNTQKKKWEIIYIPHR